MHSGILLFFSLIFLFSLTVAFAWRSVFIHCHVAVWCFFHLHLHAYVVYDDNDDNVHGCCCSSSVALMIISSLSFMQRRKKVLLVYFSSMLIGIDRASIEHWQPTSIVYATPNFLKLRSKTMIFCSSRKMKNIMGYCVARAEGTSFRFWYT